MRTSMALLLPAMLAGLTGCLDTTRAVGQKVADAYPGLKIDSMALQANEPVMIGGKRFEMTGEDHCPMIGPFSDNANDCLRLSSDRQSVLAYLKGEGGGGKVLLVSTYDEGKFRLFTTQGEPVISLR